MNNNLYYMGLYGSDDYYRSSYYPEYINERKDVTFYSENEGFMKGNIEKNIYLPYKSYNPSMPSVNSDKERLLLEIQKTCFYLTDLGLYLDIHSQDKEALKIFNENRVKYFRLINEYNKNFNPLMFVESNGVDSYEWTKGCFPWVRGK